MATTNIIELVKSHCKLYKGGEYNNPYNPDTPGDQWAMEYLKFHIWDAEYSVVQGFTGWREDWESKHPGVTLSKADKAEEIYKFAILSKLKKMQDSSDIDFIAMYFEL